MAAVAAIVDDGELDRLLAHLGVEADFPKTKPSREFSASARRLDTQACAFGRGYGSGRLREAFAGCGKPSCRPDRRTSDRGAERS